MTFMKWNDELAVGLNGVDSQHRWLVDMTNRLHDAINGAGKDRALIGEILEGLMDYTMNHFIMEEELFQRHGYPEAAQHKAQHDQFTETVMNTLTSFDNGADVGPEVLELLKNWLVKHIMVTDKAYAPFMAEHGVH